MENSFEHAKAYAHKFFERLGQGLDHTTAVLLMTDWAAQFSHSAVKEAGKIDLEAITAPLKAEIDQLKALIVSKDEAHAGALASLQASKDIEVAVATATPIPLAIIDPAPEVTSPAPKAKAKKAE